MTKKKIEASNYSFEDDSINFNYEIKKVKLSDYGKAEFTIVFDDPSELYRIYFLDSSRIADKRKYSSVTGFTSLVREQTLRFKEKKFNAQNVSNKNTQIFNVDLFPTAGAEDISVLIGMSSLEGYHIDDNEILNDSRYVVPMEDLREETTSVQKIEKGEILYVKTAETSHNAGHHHRYVVDKNGNGVTVAAIYSDGSMNQHKHTIINYEVKSARVNQEAHAHQIESGVLEFLRTVEAIAEERIVNEEENQQSVY